MSTSRRNFVKSVATASVLLPMKGFPVQLGKSKSPDNPKKGKISAFSKLFQFLDFDQLSEVFAAAGLDGIDLTVRPDGHVEPERVKTDLPKAISAARKNGLEVQMMTTSITNADNKLNQEVLKTAADLGVTYYRTGGLFYDYSKPILENLENTRRIFDKLAVFNEKTGIHGAYQNHITQPRIGSSIWDLWYILKEIDPQWMSCQYDIWHATIEGHTSWETGLRLISPYIKTRIIKDFTWIVRNGKMVPEVVPLGEGQIDFDAYFKLLNKIKLGGDTSLGFEYPVLSSEEVNLPMKAKIDIALEVLKRDTDKLKSMMNKNNYLL
jgi:L-ribulose-5-phosphate 3-epimerase